MLGGLLIEILEKFRLLSTNKIKFQNLISQKYEITDFQKAYESLKSDNLASVFDYGEIEKKIYKKVKIKFLKEIFLILIIKLL